MPAFPEPSIEAIAHTQALTRILQQRMHAQDNWMSFADFMHAALYEPGLGYYVAGARKFGAAGDFVTAPEISSRFSYCLAQQCSEVLQQLDSGSILEFGAGTGIMAADILLALEAQQCLPEYYYIVEVSPELQQRQGVQLQHSCPHLLPRVQWLSVLPCEFEGVVLANEVLDAMPVHVFEVQAGQKRERGVTIIDNRWEWKTQAPLRHHWANDTLVLPDGYVSEISYAIAPWLVDLYQSMQRGVVLLVDYGFPEQEYYHAERNQGTLMCHYRHQAHTNPFLFLGLQDITAHIDFTALARAAIRAGFILSGYASQAGFLMALGILENIAENAPVSIQYQHAQAIKKLLLPSEMGELFKVMALHKGCDRPLCGFALQNDLYRLGL